MPNVKLFIGGSRAVSKLKAPLRERLDRIIAQGHQVLIGDANGADRIVQQHLAAKHYPNVTVFCSGGRCRNNVGEWPTVAIVPPAGVHGGFDFYAAKDREMASNATHGFMLWDGKSRGTFANIKNLVRDGKPVVVYLSGNGDFLQVRNLTEVESVLLSAVPQSSPNEDPAVSARLEFTLSPAALARLQRPVHGRGGFQQLLKKLQRQLRDQVLTLDAADAERLSRYSQAYGLGGFQNRTAPSSHEIQQLLLGFDQEFSFVNEAT